MKATSVILILFCFGALSAFSQNTMKLNIVKNSDDPLSKMERYSSLELENNSSETKLFEIITLNISCSDTGNNRQVNLIQKITDINKVEIANTITLSAGETFQFYLKTKRPPNTKLTSYNCTQVIAKTNNGSLISEPILIKTFIPNPQNFN